MLAALLLASACALDGEARASWRCEPATVEVGEPFRLVLEIEHPRALPGRSLIAGELALDDTWVLFEREPLRSEDGGDGQSTHTIQSWRIASLEPGKRSLAEASAACALAESVAKIQVGTAEVEVRAVLAEGEDAPRLLAGFPPDFGAGDASGSHAGVRAQVLWIALSATVLALVAGAWLWLRRRRRRATIRPVTVFERLGELEAAIEGGQGRESCYELTRLLREATDRAGNGADRERAGLTDEQWLGQLSRSSAVPESAVEELRSVFERAARVKYAGEAATSWSLKETFAKARVVLQAVGAGGAQS